MFIALAMKQAQFQNPDETKGKEGKNERATRKEQSKSCSMLTGIIVSGQPSPETEVNDLVFIFKDRKYKFERI